MLWVDRKSSDRSTRARTIRWTPPADAREGETCEGDPDGCNDGDCSEMFGSSSKARGDGPPVLLHGE
jgi:hypothetical protein